MIISIFFVLFDFTSDFAVMSLPSTPYIMWERESYSLWKYEGIKVSTVYYSYRWRGKAAKNGKS